MLTRPHPPPDETLTLPPISTLTIPYASAPRLILSLAYNHYAPAGPSSHGSDTALTPLMPPCTRGVPSQCASNNAYHPYSHGVPSQNASNAAYHPYACIVPAQHASNACSALPTCLRCCLPSLCLLCPPDMPPTPPSHWLLMIIMLLQPPISTLTTPYASAPPPYLLCHLQFLRSHCAFKICPQFHPQPPLCLILSPQLTILILKY
ncbi:hypothetical protein O181_103040 [Austropuccinia psidii MF-1]|uniref:Uncharacterized protein n=1 Tax=Austropuccinia psidii MF-1 TaxID=1389203 RepID=A0A9Q3JHD4_9BASI|nr:hypothetical protein [Austropuccinia psidii MF-1]